MFRANSDCRLCVDKFFNSCFSQPGLNVSLSKYGRLKASNKFVQLTLLVALSSFTMTCANFAIFKSSVPRRIEAVNISYGASIFPIFRTSIARVK